MDVSMKNLWKVCAVAFLAVSCNNVGGGYDSDTYLSDSSDVEHEMIVLGDKLENPYSTEAVQDAFSDLYPTKARDVVSTTDLYVRFLPKDEDEYELLTEDLGLELFDHPMDYEIVTDGDYYHDPTIAEDAITWQYAVVDKDFEFPDVQYEILEECFISDDADAETRAMEGIDWEAVEAQAYRLTGNADLLDEEILTRSTKYYPAGRITIVDDLANGGQPFGVAGVKISCHTFVKTASTYTDRDGYYTMSKKFSARLRYRLVFKNTKGFKIGLNLIFVTASHSSLGKASPKGLDATITKNSNGALFRRSVVNNAAYDYYERCGADDMDITLPPNRVRFWIFKNLDCSSAVMMHHDAIISSDLIKGFLGMYYILVKVFAPDITIGAKGCNGYSDLYDTVVHELSHASHFKVVGTKYWNKYAWYILSSYITSGWMTYGDGSDSDAGYCEVGEMWGYYMESVMHKDRYGGTIPAYGTSYWFYPQIFRYLDERGFTKSDIFAALTSDVTDRDKLEDKLIELYPDKKTIIEQAFNRYK